MNSNFTISDIIAIAEKAGEAIMKIYEQDFSIVYKDDASPLTDADRASHDIILKELKIFQFPVLSEEGKAIPYSERKEWKTFWLVDPIDGTKEFIKKNGEFTVNIALVKEGRPVLGVVHVPAKAVTYYSYENQSYLKDASGAVKNLPAAVNQSPEAKIRVVASRSHMSKETENFIEELKKTSKEVELVSSGSSLKLCLVAEGAADIYPRLGPTMEWDTAAAQAVAEGAGKKVIRYETGESLDYNKENLLNPWFVVK